jgi:Pyruvate/2-oxoacid:ferredoxin oxidoreductase delta subunit
MTTRPIIRIDEDKCDGCGKCADACMEGAIQIIDGKAKLISEIYCDGLGACIGECPQDAITIEEREAAPFDEKAVEEHLKKNAQPATPCPDQAASKGLACPGMALRDFGTSMNNPEDEEQDSSSPAQSALRNWPVQLKLLPVNAPYFNNARLLITADCVPFAYAGYHKRFLKGRVALVGCPKLDDVNLYISKLTEIFRTNEIKDIEVLHMEVPCCTGLVRIVQKALEESGRDIPARFTKIGIQGEVLESYTMDIKDPV